MANAAFVYCPNAKCNATKDSPVGHSWRWTGQGPSNCKKCHFAFLLGKQYHRGGPHNGGSGKTSDKDPTGRSYAQVAAKGSKSGDAGKEASERTQFIPAEDGAIRKWLIKRQKDKAGDAEFLAAVDQLIPPTPQTPEEKLEEAATKLAKAQRMHKHEASKLDSMQQAAVRRAKELLEYKKSLADQRDKATQAKEELERCQAEHDKIHAESSPPPLAAAATTDTLPISAAALVTRELSESKLLDGVDAERANQIKDLVLQLHSRLAHQDRAAACQGQPQQQDQQQQQQQSGQEGAVQQGQQSQQQAQQQPSRQQAPVAAQTSAQQHSAVPPQQAAAGVQNAAAAGAGTPPPAREQQEAQQREQQQQQRQQLPQPQQQPQQSTPPADMEVESRHKPVRPRDTTEEQEESENKRLMAPGPADMDDDLGLHIQDDMLADAAALNQASEFAEALAQEAAAGPQGQSCS